jgi:hypothetical protein
MVKPVELLFVVLAMLLESDAVLVDVDDGSFQMAGGPSVSPFRACAACLILNAMLPTSHEILKRPE